MSNITNSDLVYVLNALSKPHMVLDLEQRIVSINNSSLALIGRNRAEVIGKKIDEISDPQQNQEIFRAIEHTAVDGIRREVINKSGDLKLITTNIINRVGDLLVIETEDITEIYQAKNRERLEAAKREALSEKINQAIVTIDFLEQSISHNSTSLEIFGDYNSLKPIFFAPLFDMSKYDYENDPNFDFPNSKPIRDLISTIKEVWQSGHSKDELLQRTNGDGNKLIHRRVSRWDIEGISRGIIITGSDVTDLFKLREELAESNYKIEQLLSNSNIWMVVYDESTGVAEYLRSDGVTRTPEGFIETLTIELKEQVQKAIDSLYLNGVHTFEIFNPQNSRLVRTSLSFLDDAQPGNRKILAICQDVTRQAELERNRTGQVHSIQVQKFAQGVAHDFGNIAQSFDGYSRLLRSEVKSDRAQLMLQQLTNAANRALKITTRISEIARIQMVKNSEVDLIELLNDSMQDLVYMVGKDVNLKLNIEDHFDGRAFGNALELQRLIENIVENANRAMSGKGNLEISCQENPRTNEVLISISNDGPAIPKSVADDIFSPFVSTRKEFGAGLGLYLASQYLQSCGGSIELRNHNRDVEFVIHLQRSGGDSE